MWGIGVTSLIIFTSRPTVCSARIAAGSRTLYVYFYRLQTVFHCCLCCGFSSCLCSERSRLSGATEAQSARACPRNGVALCVGDGYDGVVECGLNVYSTVFNVLTLSAAANNNLFAFLLCQNETPSLTSSCLRWSLPDPCGFLRLSWYAALLPAGPCGDARHGSNRFQRVF